MGIAAARKIVRLVGLWIFLASVLASADARGGEEPYANSLLPAAPPSPLKHPLVGERLAFHGRWLTIPVGFGWIEVKEVITVDGRQAYHIHAEGHSNDVLSTFYPINDAVDSYLDVETLQPLRFVKHQREGHYRADEVVTFDYAKRVATYRSLLNDSVKEVPLPVQVQDVVSALYWFRAQPLQPPQTLSVNLYTDEKIYQTTIQIQQAAPLELLKRGTFSCFVVEPKALFKGLLVKRGRLWAYVTADSHRLPLLVRMTTPWGPMSAVIDETSIPSELVHPPHR